MSEFSPKTKRPPKKTRRLPGRREFQILEILWQHHPLTVAQIRRLLPASTPLAYTTVMTQLDHLHRKGLVRRERVGRAFLYEPVAEPEQLRAALLQEFLADFFHSDPARLSRMLPGQPEAPPPARPEPPRPVSAAARPTPRPPAPPPEDEDYLL